MIVNGIVGILLGLLFGWMLGRPRGPFARSADRADKRRREMLAQRQRQETAKAPAGYEWMHVTLEDVLEGYTPEDDTEDETDYQDPDADQSAIIRSGCTCGTTSTVQCPYHDSWRLDNSTTHVTQMDPGGQWTHTTQAGQAEKGD